MWQIGAYLLTLGTFKRNSDIYWRISCWLGYSRAKSKRAVIKDWRTFLKKPWIFRFVTLPLEIVNSREKTANPRKFWKIMVYCFFRLEISTRPKTKTDGNSTWFFLDQLITPRNSTSFLIEPWNFLMLFHFFNIPTPGICMSLGDLCSLPTPPPPPLFLNFSGMACTV